MQGATMEVWIAVPQWLRLDIILLCACWNWWTLVEPGTVVYVKETDENTQGQPPPRSSTQSDQPIVGESPPKCMYSFVVNELDSSKCPMLFQNLPPMQNEEPTGRRGGHSSNSVFDGEGLNKRIAMLEDKLAQEMEDNNNLRSNLAEHTKLLRKAEKTLSTQSVNLTNLVLNMHDLKHKLNKQKTVWKNMDNKLLGVMLDVAEVHNKIEKVKDPPVALEDKTIPVIAVSDNVHCPNIPPNATKYIDCGRLYDTGHRTSGVYYVTPLYTNCPIPVYCDMDTPPGGWMVLMRRTNGSLNYHRGWEAYRKGFGEVTKEFWFGNDNIFLISNQGYYELRVDLYDFYGSRVYAQYQTFKIDGERDNYRLHIGNYTGTAADGFSSHDGVEFSTPDRDHDYWPDYHCAREWTAGWWFNNCWFVFLTGPYYNTTDVKYRGISWNDWKQEQLKHVEMKIRPYA